MGTEAVKVVILNPWFLPAFKAGGPVTSIRNLVNSVVDVQWSIITSAYDLGDQIPLEGIQTNTWYHTESYQVFYASGSIFSFLKRLLSEVNSKACIVYINGMYSFRFSILPLLLFKLMLLRPRKVVLAPRGMLRSSALAKKTFKKRIYLSFFNFLSIFRNIHFHATDATEVNDIKNVLHLKNAQNISLLPNLPAAVPDHITIPEKEPGAINLFFLGRVHPIKNVHLIPEMLKPIIGRIKLSFIGFVEDINYWNKVKEELEVLDTFVDLTVYPQGLSPVAVQKLLHSQHVLLLPTSGENFGHAIYESLSEGKPVVISDQTPWLNLATEGVGYDLPLNELQKFSEVLQKFVDMSNDEYRKCASACNQFAKNYTLSLAFIPEYKKLLSLS